MQFFALAHKNKRILWRALVAMGLASWVSLFNSCQPLLFMPSSLQPSLQAETTLMARQSDSVTALAPPSAIIAESASILNADSVLASIPLNLDEASESQRLTALNRALDTTKKASLPSANFSANKKISQSLVYVPDQGKSILGYFLRTGNSSADMRNGADVQPIFLRHLPSDIATIRQIEKKKELYYQIILPLLVTTNERILRERNFVLNLAKEREHKGMSFEGKVITDIANARLNALAARYNAQNESVAELLKRIQPIPVDLMLAQSIEESGWATSRLSLQGNALFGERTWGHESEGLIPHKRKMGETFKVKAFDSLQDSVDSYADNLNSHFAYQDFREKREQLRASNQAITGLALIDTLTAYSTRRQAYLNNIKRIIKSNDLDDFLAIRLCDCSDHVHIDVQRDIQVAQYDGQDKG